MLLTSKQVEEFLDDGVLVVENILSEEEILQSLQGLKQTLANNGVRSFDIDDEDSARAFNKLSSTNGSGGVLDLFYEDWKLDIATNPKLFSVTKQLWSAAYCHNGEKKEHLPSEKHFKWHPYGAFDCTKGYLYLDRIGYRLPTTLAQKLGDRINSHKKKKTRALQRSLTPHLDCCPERLFAETTKWRPIQCFVSLTENLEANLGGFEVAKGFHRNFDEWAQNRPPTIIEHVENGKKSMTSVPAPCMGEYTHIRPKEDREVMERVLHVPVPAGSAVFWDNRLPHANAYRHDGSSPRVVVYCSFLPDVERNRVYAKNQLNNWRTGRPPRDQWNHMEEDRIDGQDCNIQNYSFTNLGEKLMGIESW